MHDFGFAMTSGQHGEPQTQKSQNSTETHNNLGAKIVNPCVNASMSSLSQVVGTGTSGTGLD